VLARQAETVRFHLCSRLEPGLRNQWRMRANRNLLRGIKRAGSFKILAQKYSACQLLKISII
jgi:hypothetical protein